MTKKCPYWKMVHTRTPKRYNGTHYLTTGPECTRPAWCEHNTEDAKMGGCKHKGYPPEEETA